MFWIRSPGIRRPKPVGFLAAQEYLHRCLGEELQDFPEKKLGFFCLKTEAFGADERWNVGRNRAADAPVDMLIVYPTRLRYFFRSGAEFLNHQNSMSAANQKAWESLDHMSAFPGSSYHLESLLKCHVQCYLSECCMLPFPKAEDDVVLSC